MSPLVTAIINPKSMRSAIIARIFGTFLLIGILTISMPISSWATSAASTLPLPTLTTNQGTGLTTYTNEVYGIAFEFPTDWTITPTIVIKDQLIAITPPNEGAQRIPETSKTGTGFSLSASGISTYLDPNTLQVKTFTARDYAISAKNTNSEIESFLGYSTSNDYAKDNPVIIANETNAWRLDYIMNENGEQIEFLSDVFVIKDNILYSFHFYTQPLNVPYMLPTAEKMIKSFRFI